MTRIVLVHGAWHGAHCWRHVVSELAALGHEAVAVELADGPVGALEHAATVADAAGAGPAVLVGHSLGGLTVPVAAQVMGRAKVAGLVLVAALTPKPGMSWNEQSKATPGIMAPGFGAGQVRHEDRTTSWPAEAAAAQLYAGVGEEGAGPDAVAAEVARLRRQDWTVGREPTPLAAWPEVPTTVVVCADDRVVSPARQRERAAELPGAEVVELDGGHFPMLTRPAELAAVLSSARCSA